MIHDSLGDRMKSQYEDRTRIMLPRRTYTIVRIDGKGFHNFTRDMRRPYDEHFMESMDLTASGLCKEMHGAQFAYTQSDEISILLTDFQDIKTDAWFDGNLQKICSVSASMATAFFNNVMRWHKVAVFDSRVFTIPDPVEVENYFIWRQKDAERNSLQMLAQHYASHKELHGVSRMGQHNIIHEAGDNWDNHPARFKRGAVIFSNRETETPVFTKDRSFLQTLIPRHWDCDKETA